ncbi:protease modulator HflC, partial [Burkholderia gladioli]|nr:protease modulator HflC [Burkholderia gladioli]
MNRIVALVIALVVVAFVASSTVFIVDPRHAA